jgi:hypothetical protein
MRGVAGTGVLFVLLVLGGSVSNVRAGRDECGSGAALAVSASDDGLQASGHGAGAMATARRRTPLPLVRPGIVFVDGVQQEGKANNKRKAA